MDFTREGNPIAKMGIGLSPEEIFNLEWKGYPTRFQKDASEIGASVLYTDVDEGEEPIEASYYWNEEEKEWVPECMCLDLF